MQCTTYPDPIYFLDGYHGAPPRRLRKDPWDGRESADIAAVWVGRIGEALGYGCADLARLKKLVRLVSLGGAHSFPAAKHPIAVAAQRLGRGEAASADAVGRAGAILHVALRFTEMTLARPGVKNVLPSIALRELQAISDPLIADTVRGLISCFSYRLSAAA